MNKIEVAEKMLVDNEEQLLQLEIREAYLQRIFITDKNRQVEIELAQVSASVKEVKRWMDYLKEKIKDKFK